VRRIGQTIKKAAPGGIQAVGQFEISSFAGGAEIAGDFAYGFCAS